MKKLNYLVISQLGFILFLFSFALYILIHLKHRDIIDYLVLSLTTAAYIIYAVFSVIKKRDEKREIEKKKRALELLEKAVESSTNLIVIHDDEGKIIFVNKAFTDKTGYSKEECYGRDIRIIRSYFHDESFYSEMHKVIEKRETWRGEVCNKKKNGELYWENKTITPISEEDGKAKFFINVSEDITENKKIKEELINQEMKMREMIASSSDAILIVNDKDEIEYTNGSFEYIFGYTDSEMKKMKMDQIMNAVEENLEKISGNAFDMRVSRKDGKKINVSVTFSTYDSNGTYYSAFFIRDITEKVRMEQELKDKVQKINDANAELQNFVYVISHDLREPLRIIESYLKLLEKRYSDKIDDNGKEFIEFAVDGAVRMKEMLAGLLEYSRIGSKEKKITVVNLNEAAEYAMKNLGKYIQEKNAKVDIGDLGRAQVDFYQIVSVFQNLISNGIKYNKNEIPEINISAERENGFVLCRIKDNGIGIPNESLKDIFSIFKRLHTSDEYEGNGLGLANCKKIIEMHGGNISVESEEEKGSVFTFTVSEEEKNEDINCG